MKATNNTHQVQAGRNSTFCHHTGCFDEQSYASTFSQVKCKKDRPSFISNLQNRWKLNSVWKVIATLIAFSLAGSTVVFIRPIFFSWLGFTEQTSLWLKTITYVLFVFPAYQILLLGYGTMLGQFSFFWEKEKKLVASVRAIFFRKEKVV